MLNRHHVVIVGGGFGGLRAALGLRRAPVRITLIDRRNFHLFQPLLYQVATGGLSPANIAAPLRRILNRQKNARVLMDEVTGFDLPTRRVLCQDRSLQFDTLIVATGVRHNYFGRDDWEQFAPGLKTIEDATEIRARVLAAFEKAELTQDVEEMRALLTFVVIGAGPTGVELAGALAEIARDTLRRDFRAIDSTYARILLLDGAERVLPGYPAELSQRAEYSLRKLGVTVRTGVRVMNVTAQEVSTESSSGQESIATRTVLWAAGVQGSPLGRMLAEATGATLDRAGRITVSPDLSVTGFPDVFVIGDLAVYTHDGGNPLPGVAPVAMQEGTYVAGVIAARLAGRPTPHFHYVNRGNMATIGRAAAVADLGWIRFSGYPAWLAWLFVHLVFLIEFHNRVLVLIQWAWSYITFNRSARLITGRHR